jgi:hypothetical protein
MRMLWVLALLGAHAAAAQGPGADGPAVVQSPGSVRAVGLGGAGAALMGDAGAVFSNPAGLATIPHISLEGGFYGAPFDAYQVTGALGVRIGQFDLGFGLKNYDFGSEPEVVPDPATGGVTGMPTGQTVRARDLLAAGSLIYRIGIIAFGGTVKVVDQHVADLSDRGVSGDIGLALALFDIAALGFSVQNLGGDWRSASGIVLPRLSRLGFTMNYVDPQETFRLLSTVEWQWRAGEESRFVVGVEGGIVASKVGVLLRGAYGSRRTDAAPSAFTVGGSLTLDKLTLDYAYQPVDLLGGGSQRLGLRLVL